MEEKTEPKNSTRYSSYFFLRSLSYVRSRVTVAEGLSDEGFDVVELVSHCNKRTIDESAFAPEQTEAMRRASDRERRMYPE